jgi:hypothetical protein
VKVEAAAREEARSRSSTFGKRYIMTRERLFGEGPWRADKKTAVALNRQFIEMGLYERVTYVSLGS